MKGFFREIFFAFSRGRLIYGNNNILKYTFGKLHSHSILTSNVSTRMSLKCLITMFIVKLS